MRRSSKPIAILATTAALVGGAVAHAATGSDGAGLDGTGHHAGADDARHGHDHHAGPLARHHHQPQGDGPVPGDGAVVVVSRRRRRARGR